MVIAQECWTGCNPESTTVSSLLRYINDRQGNRHGRWSSV
jgi:hypothetical protein